VFEVKSTNIKTEKDNRTSEARKYRGAGESTPRSQVAKMPPKLPMMAIKAVLVARLV
jgi:hypothetical protein